jgi:predicted DNA-binding transcriptional regulator AlpA
MARDELLTSATVLAELGEEGKPLPKSTFYEWRAKRRAPRCIKLPNGSLRIWRSDFTWWPEERTEAAR